MTLKENMDLFEEYRSIGGIPMVSVDSIPPEGHTELSDCLPIRSDLFNMGALTSYVAFHPKAKAGLEFEICTSTDEKHYRLGAGKIRDDEVADSPVGRTLMGQYAIPPNLKGKPVWVKLRVHNRDKRYPLSDVVIVLGSPESPVFPTVRR